jgi:hypothetical protein
VNFVQGDGIEISLADNPGGDQVNVVISSTIDLANLAVTNKLTVGANVQVNTSTLSLGNSTVSLTANSTKVVFASGGQSANIGISGVNFGGAIVNSTGFFVGTSVQNSTHQTATNITATANVTGFSTSRTWWVPIPRGRLTRLPTWWPVMWFASISRCSRITIRSRWSRASPTIP